MQRARCIANQCDTGLPHANRAPCGAFHRRHGHGHHCPRRRPRLSERLGQPVVVQNVPGASSNIGSDQVAKAKPDGHTLLVGVNTMLIATLLHPNVPFDPVRDFCPLHGGLWHPDAGGQPEDRLQAFPDLMAQARSKPGSITYGSPGVGTPHHMAMELFKSQARLFLLHVPYRGTAGYTQDPLSGPVFADALCRNSPCKWIYRCTQKKGPVLRLALKGSLNLEVSKGPEETTSRNLFA